MDLGLVRAEARGGCPEGVLYPRKSARRPPRRQLRPASAEHQNPAQGDQGRLASVRAELLPPLPAGGAACGSDRYLDKPSRVSLCDEGGTHGIVVSLEQEEGGMADDPNNQQSGARTPN